MEMIIYLALLSIFLLVVIDSLIGFSSSYKKMRVSRLVTDSAAVFFESVSREARDSHDVDLAQSILNTSPGKVRLAAFDLSGAPANVTIALENGAVNLYREDVYLGPITPKEASTTELVFRLLDNGRTKALRIEMLVTATSGPYVKTENFEDTIVLRGSI